MRELATVVGVAVLAALVCGLAGWAMRGDDEGGDDDEDGDHV